MDYDWYTAEQEVRDRLTEARAHTRMRGMIGDFEARPPRPKYVRSTFTVLANGVSVLATRLRVECSRALARVRAVVRHRSPLAREARVPIRNVQRGHKTQKDHSDGLIGM